MFSLFLSLSLSFSLFHSLFLSLSIYIYIYFSISPKNLILHHRNVTHRFSLNLGVTLIRIFLHLNFIYKWAHLACSLFTYVTEFQKCAHFFINKIKMWIRTFIFIKKAIRSITGRKNKWIRSKKIIFSLISHR